MQVDISKSNLIISEIQCSNWDSGNIFSKGISIEFKIIDTTLNVSFIFDLTYNLQTRNKEENSFLDTIYLINHIDSFKTLVLRDSKICENIYKILSNKFTKNDFTQLSNHLTFIGVDTAHIIPVDIKFMDNNRVLQFAKK